MMMDMLRKVATGAQSRRGVLALSSLSAARVSLQPLTCSETSSRSRLLTILPSCFQTATHINFCPVTPPAILSLVSPRTLLAWLPSWAMSEQKRQRTEKALQFVEKGSSYYAMQKLTPRTPAYALIDSPVGLLAWIGEKVGD